MPGYSCRIIDEMVRATHVRQDVNYNNQIRIQRNPYKAFLYMQKLEPLRSLNKGNYSTRMIQCTALFVGRVSFEAEELFTVTSTSSAARDSPVCTPS